MLNNYTGERARPITAADAMRKKTGLEYNEKRALFGYLIELYRANESEWRDCLGIEFMDLYNASMIQNDELRLYCGDGIELGDGCRLDSIFLNKFGVLCMSVLDANDNETIYC